MKKVLIVEDEILARLGLRQLVDWRKLELELLPDATDGEEALEMNRNSCPDIILLDLNIPKVSGLEILEFLKKEEIPTKVIVVSCQEEFDVVKKAMKLGAYDYLRKLNLSSDELENILEKCLVETEERITVHMQGIREIRYEEIVRDSRDILAGACNYQTLICILAKDTEELSRVTEIIHKWAETELREGLQIQKGNQYGYFLLEEKPEKSVYMELKKRAERKTDRELYMGIFEGCMEKTADIVRAAAMGEQIQLFSYYDVVILMNFFRQIPASLEESAQIDGAGVWKIFLSIAMPLSKPALATIALFNGVYQWNDFMTAKLYMTNKDLYPVQMKLYEIIVQQQAQSMNSIGNVALSTTSKGIQLATIVVTTVPIIIIYPLLQKHFVSGMMLGAVKE